MLLPLTGGVPGFTSIPLPNSFISMSIYNTSQKATESHVKTSLFIQTVKYTWFNTLLVGGCIMLWLGPMMPRYG